MALIPLGYHTEMENHGREKAQKPLKSCRTICVPVAEETDAEIVNDPQKFRRRLNEASQQTPELFPDGFETAFPGAFFHLPLGRLGRARKERAQREFDCREKSRSGGIARERPSPAAAASDPPASGRGFSENNRQEMLERS